MAAELVRVDGPVATMRISGGLEPLRSEKMCVRAVSLMNDVPMAIRIRTATNLAAFPDRNLTKAREIKIYLSMT